MRFNWEIRNWKPGRWYGRRLWRYLSRRRRIPFWHTPVDTVPLLCRCERAFISGYPSLDTRAWRRLLGFRAPSYQGCDIRLITFYLGRVFCPFGEGFFRNSFLICQVRDVDGVGFTFKYTVPLRSSDMFLWTMECIGIGISSCFWTSAWAIL